MRHRKGQRELVQTEEKGLDEVEEEREGKLLHVTRTNHTHSSTSTIRSQHRNTLSSHAFQPSPIASFTNTLTL